MLSPSIGTRALAVASVALASSCAGESDSGTDSDSNDIIGGWPSRNEPAVVAITREGALHCTGTLVTTRRVLTAAHCLSSWNVEELRVVANSTDVTNLADDALVLEPHRAWVHPDYDAMSAIHDLGILEIPEIRGINPSPVYLGPLTDRVVGLQMRLVGYGKTAPSEPAGRKLEVLAAITGLEAHHIAHEAKTCPGDSGGPGFLRFRGVEMVFGVHSTGSCGRGIVSRKTRLDHEQGYLAPFLSAGRGEIPPPEERIDTAELVEVAQRNYADPRQVSDSFRVRCSPDKSRLSLVMEGVGVRAFLRHEAPASEAEHDLSFESPVGVTTDSETPPGIWSVHVEGDPGLVDSTLSLACTS